MMLNKQIEFGDDARMAIYAGMNKLANAVKVSLGPQGRTVIIGDWNNGDPHTTKDGVTIAKAIQLADPYAEAGVRLMREAATRTVNGVGDGTTTSTVLAQAMLQLINNQSITNISEFRRGMEDAKDYIVKQLRQQATPIKAGDIAKIATISANNDSEIGNLIADAFSKITNDGVITVDESNNIETTIDIINGMQFDRGYVAPHFITNEAKNECVLENPYIFITDKKINRLKDIGLLLNDVAKEGRSILIMAEDFDDEVVQTLKLNKLQGILKCCLIKAPSFGEYRKEVLEDIAILTDGISATYDNSIEFNKMQIQHLGEAKRVIVTKDTTTIIGGVGSETSIKARVEVLKQQLKDAEASPTTAEFMIGFYKTRIAKMIGR